jgi:hypothetical protein
VVGPFERPVPPILFPLSHEDQRLYSDVISGMDPSTPLGTNPSLDVRCLRPGKRISESVMDAFFQKLSIWVEHNPDWGVAQSDLFAHLRHSSPPSRGACSKLARLLRAKDFALLPCCLYDHWILVLIRSNRLSGPLEHRVIYLVNSLGTHLDHLLMSVLNEALGMNLPFDSWPLTWSQAKIPCQQQGQGSVDCGIHVMHNALSLAARFSLGFFAGPSFSPSDFRIRAAAAIASPVSSALWGLGGVQEFTE